MPAKHGRSFCIETRERVIRCGRSGALFQPVLARKCIIEGSVRQDPLRPAVVRRSAGHDARPAGQKESQGEWSQSLNRRVGSQGCQDLHNGNHVQI